MTKEQIKAFRKIGRQIRADYVSNDILPCSEIQRIIDATRTPIQLRRVLRELCDALLHATNTGTNKELCIYTRAIGEIHALLN